MLKRRFSQNLIKDGNILRKMVSLAGITAEDTVVEIGAGQGDLTRAIAASAARVIAIELDREMIPHLEAARIAFPNVEIVSGDILAVDVAGLARGRTVRVMGNIPYGITGPIIFKLIGERRSIESAFLTVQKEIGERMTANPGPRAYGSLSVASQLVADVKVLMHIRAHVFIPSPKVDSIYLAMRFRDDTDDIDDALLAFIRQAFRHKRKFMRHALLETYPGAEVEALYERMDFPRSVRAETLEPKTFLEMYKVLKETRE
jgi:16S rRNA (adenine1518-N6/adenine1519-N6)-dimethyltransferase